MTKIQIELPDATAQAAQAAEILAPEALERLYSNALRKQQAADRTPMSMEEINAEVNAAREERRQRASSMLPMCRCPVCCGMAQRIRCSITRAAASPNC